MRLLKPAAHLLCALPLTLIIVSVLTNQAGANPVEHVIRELGEWALRFLLIALAVTPIRKFTGWAQVMTLRRMLGLWAFAYACLHLTAFWGADLSFSLSALWREILKRPYITVGMVAVLLLLPLAVTSTQKMIKRLGGVRWRKLHQLVYLVGILGCLHFYWVKSSKNLLTQPLIYAGILALLLLYRILDAKGLAPRLPRRAKT
jgi:methionine sulfoxide reductase heme-binding subunit